MLTVTIPREIVKKEALIAVPKKDYREFSAWRNNIQVHFDERWFWALEWQKKEAEADVAIKKGRISKLFSNHKELLSALKSKKKT